ncbi:MAG: protein kinase [Myxococcota bacterium]|nr:protein kinase [Myxococcota bacterium]
MKYPTLANGRYEIRSQLGEGGMATVFHAYDTRLRMDRAIKVLQPHLCARKAIKDRFEVEASTMAKLHHKHIVTIYDIVTQDNMVFMVMELLNGGSLMDRLEDHGALPPKLAVEAAIEISKSISHAHKNGVIHRDIKPHNILISEDGILKMTDFGIARIEDGSVGVTKTGAVMGTVAYMAPEQRISAKRASVVSDIYALAATLYVLLTVGNPIEIFLEEEQDILFKDLDPDIVTLLKKGCHQNQKERYQTTEEWIEALEKLLELLEEPDDSTLPVYIERDITYREPSKDQLHTITSFLNSYSFVSPGPQMQTPALTPDGFQDRDTILVDDLIDEGETVFDDVNSEVTTMLDTPKAESPKNPLVFLATIALFALVVFFGLRSTQNTVGDPIVPVNPNGRNLSSPESPKQPVETPPAAPEKPAVPQKENAVEKTAPPAASKEEKPVPKTTEPKTQTKTRTRTKSKTKTQKKEAIPNGPKVPVFINSIPYGNIKIGSYNKRAPIIADLPAGSYTVTFKAHDGRTKTKKVQVKEVSSGRFKYCWDFNTGLECPGK